MIFNFNIMQKYFSKRDEREEEEESDEREEMQTSIQI